MKLRLPVVALTSFGLGLAAMWGVATQTHWLRFVQARTEFRAINPATDVAWKPNAEQDRVTYFMKFLAKDDHTAAATMLLRYPAGQINPAHTHPVGHGMYVLQGKLVTNRGTFGPGSYVWFPPDQVMSHGAGPDEEVVVLFITHYGMTTDYVASAGR